MLESDFHREISDDWNNTVPRLIYADWLEEHGMDKRALFIRNACERWELERAGRREGYFSALGKECRFWRECKPKYWPEYVYEVRANCYGGVWRFEFGSNGNADPVAKVGRKQWLADAHLNGWLDRVELDLTTDNLNAITKWREKNRCVPIAVRYHNRRADRRALETCLALPNLVGLLLQTKMGEIAFSASKISGCKNLKELSIHVTGSTIANLVDEIATLSNLTCLRLKFAANYLNEEEFSLLPLAQIENLRYLEIEGLSITDSIELSELERTNPRLTIQLQ